jgi:hypothetical protein
MTFLFYSPLFIKGWQRAKLSDGVFAVDFVGLADFKEKHS